MKSVRLSAGTAAEISPCPEDCLRAQIPPSRSYPSERRTHLFCAYLSAPRDVVPSNLCAGPVGRFHALSIYVLCCCCSHTVCFAFECCLHTGRTAMTVRHSVPRSLRRYSTCF